MNRRPRMRPNNPDLRDALDAIMKHLDVEVRAEAGLEEEDRAWFSETLAKEPRELRKPPRYEAGLTGSGDLSNGGVGCLKSAISWFGKKP